MSEHLDPFTQRRLVELIKNFRVRTGQLPTLQDLMKGGFSQECVEQAIKKKCIEQLYVTLTNGSVVKAYKVHVDL